MARIQMLRALILLAVPTVILALGRTQSVGVKGQLICEDKPAVGVKIKIYDEDKRKLPSFFSNEIATKI